MKLEIKRFEKDYDRGEFYKLMGHFFGEREWQRKFPYLSNEDGRVWILAIEKGVVYGFTTFINRKNYLDLGYTFGATTKLKNELLDLRFDIVEKEYPNAPMKSALPNPDTKDLEKWLNHGFEIEKETKNYRFVKKEEKNNE